MGSRRLIFTGAGGGERGDGLVRELGFDRFLRQEQQQAAGGRQVELGRDAALRASQKGYGLISPGIEVPALDAAQAGKHDAAGRMLDARVDQEENLAVRKLAAVMEQDALVARSALDPEAVLLLVGLEVGYNGVGLKHPVGGKGSHASRRRLGGRRRPPAPAKCR